MSSGDTPTLVVEDRCTLALVRRLAAMLDRDPATLREGDPLPFGWQVTMFNLPTPQSRLRPDGAGDLAVPLPDLGLPRLMLAGRRVAMHHAVPIGARVRRESRSGEVAHKTGRSGRFAVVPVEHRIFVEEAAAPAIVEVQEYVLREAAPTAAVAASGDASRAAASGAPAPSAPAAGTAAAAPPEPADAERSWTPDERLLFRFSAITDNPHRIHYDLPYAAGIEGYPALVVNGTLPAMALLELFRATTGREPATLASRNLAPMYANRPLRLALRRADAGWRLWATDAGGTVTWDATVA
ncbi:MAG: hypothetical protein RJA99_1028 [Pseudomonadota bacterium]|jgi:3-methylfumaryl-CoA hydratase